MGFITIFHHKLGNIFSKHLFYHLFNGDANDVSPPSTCFCDGLNWGGLLLANAKKNRPDICFFFQKKSSLISM